MISPESIKGKIKYLSNSKNLNSQEVLQMFFFERFLERLSISRYNLNFIIKGGLLISSLIGIANRTTMDLDTTLKGIPLKKEIIRKVVEEIINLKVEDGINFEISNITQIRKDEEYQNYRVHLSANYGKIKSVIKLDVTTGDVITPGEIQYRFPCMFEEKKIEVMAYTIETLLAEKYETVIKRNVATTRMRDFYDIYIIYSLRSEEIKCDILRKAIISTADKRGSLNYIREAKDIIEDIKEDIYLKRLWTVYLNENPYIENIDFDDTLRIIEIISDRIDIKGC